MGAHQPACTQSVVGGLLSQEEDHSLLLCQFREYLEHDDIRYHTMQAAADTVARVTDGHPEVSWPGPIRGGRGQRACGVRALRPGLRQVPPTFWDNAFTLLAAVSLPRQDSDISNFYVTHPRECPVWAGGWAGYLGRAPSRPNEPLPPPAFLAELSDKWKVSHLKVRPSRGAGGLPRNRPSPGVLPPSRLRQPQRHVGPRGRRPAGPWFPEVARPASQKAPQ